MPSIVALVDNASTLAMYVTLKMTAQMGVTRWTACSARNTSTNVQMENAFPTLGDVTASLTAQMGATSWIAHP